MSFYSILYKIFFRPVAACYRLKSEGEENLPPKDQKRGYIVCMNHTSFSDVFAISGALRGRRLRYMGKAELFKIPLFGSFLRALGAFPVKRGGADMKAIKNTIELLDSGEIVGIFPQGTRCPGRSLKDTQFKNGAAMFAYRSGCNVLPAYISTEAKQTRIFRKTTVVFGKIIDNSEFDFKNGGNAEYEAATRIIFDRMNELENICERKK